MSQNSSPLPHPLRHGPPKPNRPPIPWMAPWPLVFLISPFSALPGISLRNPLIIFLGFFAGMPCPARGEFNPGNEGEQVTFMVGASKLNTHLRIITGADQGAASTFSLTGKNVIYESTWGNLGEGKLSLQLRWDVFQSPENTAKAPFDKELKFDIWSLAFGYRSSKTEGYWGTHLGTQFQKISWGFFNSQNTAQWSLETGYIFDNGLHLQLSYTGFSPVNQPGYQASMRVEGYIVALNIGFTSDAPWIDLSK